MALGVAWILDGLEITIASSIGGVLTDADTLHMTSIESGAVGSVYLAGQVAGALIFGDFADRWGRRKLFMITLGVYLVGSGLGALTLGHGAFWVIFLYVTRFIAGMGIGGEYAAINSAVDELIPSKYRGRVDVAVNGTYWAGAIIGAFATTLFLSTMPESVGWHLGFALGPVLGVVILYVRRTLPESPRWQVMHGHAQEAEQTIADIEREVEQSGRRLEPVDDSKALEIRPAARTNYLALLVVLFQRYPTRAILSIGLMITQSFLYNAIYFSDANVLKSFYGVANDKVALYGVAFAVGNLLGPLALGSLFDTLGRKKMIAGTYFISGALLLVSAFMFNANALNAISQTIWWVVVFFFASAGASAGYLTMSEIFPLEVRGKAIAIIFSIAQLVGLTGPIIYGGLMGNADHPDHNGLFIGYILGAGVMIFGAVIAAIFGINAEGKSLEDIATPLSVVNKPTDSPAGSTPDVVTT